MLKQFVSCALFLIVFYARINKLLGSRDLKCPFSNCTWTWFPNPTSDPYCDISCDRSDSITRSPPLETVNRIRNFYMNSRDAIPPQTFTNLTISELTINSATMNTLASDLFSGLASIQTIYLRSLKNLKRIERNCFANIKSLDKLYINFTALDDSSLFADLTRELGQLAQLKTLYFYDNRLSTFVSIAKLATLSSLSLVQNQIEFVNKSMFGHYRNLNHLTLNRNRLTRFDESVVIDMRKLSYLELTYNSLSVLSLPNVKSLRILVLDNNRFSKWTDLNITSSITCISLANNLLTDIQIGSSFPQLASLLLSGNNIATLDKAWFASSINLTYLDLRSNSIKSIAPDTFESLVNLSTLALSGNQLEDLAFLTPLVALRNLFLVNNQIKYISNSVFSRLVNLWYLNLQNNLINQLDVDVFANNVNLFYLYLNSNFLSTLPDISNLVNQ
jgi:Leucine-rich repeat (LRR) protein